MENNNIENNTEIVETSVADAVEGTDVVETADVVEVESAEETKTESAAYVGKAKALLGNVKEKSVSLWSKIVAAFKADPKKMGIRVGAVLLAAVVVIVGLSIGINAATNSYKTPIKTMEKYANAKKYYSIYEEAVAKSNGFCEDELKQLKKLYMSSEDYEDGVEDAKDSFNDRIEDLKDEYGKNYKYTYKVIDKEKLDKDELKEYRDTLRNRANSLESIIENTEDYESDDWEDLADSMGFEGNKSKAKSMISVLKDLRKTYKSAKVSAGYRLTVVVKLTGSELDEPEENETEITVYKVNGRWIAEDGTSAIF